ncbi:AMP-dependent synthetase [Sulfolobus sp. B5]|nr:AMP-dependent synthetase [Sulfolobus sp. B5]
MNNYEIDIRALNFKNYDELIRSFSLNVPSKFNIGYSILDKNVPKNGEKIAVYYSDESSKKDSVTFSKLKNLSDSLGNALVKDLGIKRGDRVAIYLQPRIETIITLLTIYRVGAIALSISPLMGTEAVEYRLKHSEAKVIFMEGNRTDVRNKIKNIESLNHIIVVEGEANATKEIEFWDLIKSSSKGFEVAETNSEEPAQLFYTSGTTGPPKGVLHAHRFVLGHIPTFQLYFELAPKEEDVFWTPADWGWIGAIGDVILPSLYFGKPLVAYKREGKFSPEEAMRIMEDYRVTCAFIPPTALRIIKNKISPKEYDLKLRAISSAGEAVGEDLIKWGMSEFNVPINEFYGCTEANLVTTNNSLWLRIGSLGKSSPGHLVDVIDEEGNSLPPHKVGEIAVRIGDPSLFLGYWENEEATRKKFRGIWFLIGDLGYKDENGYLWFKGRADDVIKVSGYRIGPEEIESVILQHPAVKEVAVIGKPDPVRGHIIKAFIVLKENVDEKNIDKDIQEFVKRRLASYAYPREIEFVKELPRTETGKIKIHVLRERESKR